MAEIPISSYRELTDDQVDALLSRAAARMHAKVEDRVGSKPKNEMKFNFPKLDPGNILEQPGKHTDQVQFENGLRKVEDPVQAAKIRKETKKASAGPNWYNMPRTDLTPELKRDIQLIKMRNVLDPHRQYKKENGKMQAPDFSQVGTIVEGPTEFFNGRVENKNRKRTLAEEVIAGERETKRFSRRYGELQQKTTSGKKAFYKALKEKRRGSKRKGPPG